jgi:hypothetical protein
LRLAHYLAARSQANVELFPLERQKASNYASYEEKTGNPNSNLTTLTTCYQTALTAQSGRMDPYMEAADISEQELPEADLIMLDAALVRGRYEIGADTAAEGTKGMYESDEFIMDTYAEGTKGACAAHQLTLHPAVEELTKAAHCPVLTIVAHAPEVLSIKTVVLVTDGEQGMAPLFMVLSQLQHISKFTLHLLHINRLFHHQPVIESVNNMRELAKIHSLTNYQIHIMEDYTYEEGIIHFMQKVHPDMVALPVDGHKVISRLLEEILSSVDAAEQIKYLLTYQTT